VNTRNKHTISHHNGISVIPATERSCVEMDGGAHIDLTINRSLAAENTHPGLSLIQRKCVHCEDDEKARRKTLASFILRKPGENTNAAGDAVSGQIHTTKEGGIPMNGPSKSFMESRFGTDFSNVRIHTGSDASHLSDQLNAQAFTVGNDIYFNDGRFSPGTSEGRRLLAHELTHVLQQSGSNKAPHIARFTDNTHHVIDEAALTGGGFTEEQRKWIERGNKLRDYSQLPTLGNAILICEPGKFGGYEAKEHFDNYIWDKQKNEWRDRDLLANQKAGLADASIRGSDPIQYIKEKLAGFVKMGLVRNGLEQLGAAFHAVEDFFAHSNFVELIRGDYRFGHDLVTGSVPGTGMVSALHTLEDVSDEKSAAYYKARSEEEKGKTDILSHANIAKDHPGDRNHIEARRLAALVVQEFSRDLLQVMQSPETQRMAVLSSLVFTKVDHYLRLPDVQHDAWWQKLADADKGAIDALLAKAQKETPATVNQCMFSPLRNLEASKDSNIKIIAGAAVPVNVMGAQGFLQVGGGLVTPLNIDNAVISADRDSKPAWFVGGQLTVKLP